MPDEPTTHPNGAKPPFLRRVRIRNYKSIAFCDVTLEPLTILVGRNATGKSNFLDALGFLRDVVTKGVREAVKLHGGRDAVLNRMAGSPVVEIEVDLADAPENILHSPHATFALVIEFPAEGPAKLVRDRFQLKNRLGDDLMSYDMNVDGGHWGLTIGSHQYASWIDLGRSIIELIRGNESCRPYYDGLENIVEYGVLPHVLRDPQPPSPGSFLERSGRNLASVILATQKADPRAAARASRYLNAVAETVEFSGVVPGGDREFLQFRTSENKDVWNGPQRPGTPFYAGSMSDGTLRAFACIIAAFQTVAPYGSPSLVAIEEPETALHPAAMRALVAAFDEATLRTQILLTTHSPDLLDAEAVKPENVRVVQLIDGKTVIGPVDEASVSIVDDGLASLGQLEREGRLKADLGDLDRQAALAGAGAASP